MNKYSAGIQLGVRQEVKRHVDTCGFLHLHQHKGTSLAGGVQLPMSLHPRITIGRPHYLVWDVFPGDQKVCFSQGTLKIHSLNLEENFAMPHCTAISFKMA